MLQKAKIRFGMVGAGAIAQAYAVAFQNSDNAQLAAVADIREEAADAIAKSMGCDSFTCPDAMVNEVSLDAVLVCTPPQTHPEICIHALRRGIHVLCEKPLAINSQSAGKMVEAAEQSSAKFTMASKFRYVDDVIRAKAIVESGILGEIVLFENTFAGRVDMKGRWNADPAISGGGVLIDNGTHSVDIVRYFLGPLAEVQALEGKRIQDLKVEDTVRLFVRTENDVMANIDLSWSIDKESPYFISIYGAQGTVLVGWKESKYRRSSDQDWIVFGSGYNKAQAFLNQINNFVGAIRGDEALRITPTDAIASVDVIEVAYEALQDATWVKVHKEQTPQTTSASI